MGVWLELDIVAGAIDGEAWAEAYDATLALLRAWPGGLVSVRRLPARGSLPKRSVLSPRIEHEEDEPARRRWTVCGDGRGRGAEWFTLHRDLAVYDRSRPAQDCVLVEVLRHQDGSPSAARAVFRAKTQGRPYHLALLAAGMLVEARFPDHALVRGDLDRGQAEVAQGLALEHAGVELPLPICVSPERLVERLAATLPPGELPAAVQTLHAGDSAAPLRALEERVGRAVLEQWFTAYLSELASPGALGVYMVCSTWLRGVNDLPALARMGCVADAGPRWAPGAFAAMLGAARLTAPRLGLLLCPEQFGYAFVQADVPIGPSAPSPADPSAWPAPADVVAAFAEVVPAASGEVAEAVRNALTRPPPGPDVSEERSDEGPTRPSAQEFEAHLRDFPGWLEDGGGDEERVETHALAWRLKILREALRSHPDARPLHAADADALRASLARLCARQGLVLFESSWAWFEVERDRELLLAAFLLAIDPPVSWALRPERVRPVLAKRERVAEMLRLSQDDDLMRRIERWHERLQDGDPEARTP